MKSRKLNLSALYIYYFWYYAMFAVFSSFLVAYYTSIGLSMKNIGVIQSVGPLVSMIIQPFWGQLGDRAKTKNRVLIFALLLYFAAGISLQFSADFFFVTAIAGLMAFANAPVLPLTDAITLEYVDSIGYPYGYVRLAGTVGFAIVSVIMGRLADISIKNIFLVFGIVGVLTIISAFFLPKVAGHGAKAVKTDWGPLFKNKALLIVLALMFMIQLTMTFFNSYQSVYYEEQGLDLTVLGFSLLLQTISEVPFMLFSHRLIKRFGAGALMFFCSAVLMVRWFLLFLVKSTVPVLLLQFMHGPSFVFATVVMAMFMNENMSPELKARGQIFISLTSSFSRVIGNLLGGFLIDAFGSTRPVLLLFAILMAVNILMMLFLFKKVGGFKKKA